MTQIISCARIILLMTVEAICAKLIKACHLRGRLLPEKEALNKNIPWAIQTTCVVELCKYLNIPVHTFTDHWISYLYWRIAWRLDFDHTSLLWLLKTPSRVKHPIWIYKLCALKALSIAVCSNSQLIDEIHLDIILAWLSK